MEGKGRAQDNIFVERLWQTVKYEDVYLQAVGISVWGTVKWGVAVLGASETGGLSLGLLAIP
ncbi:hypothetical protein [Sphingobacterium sp.]|jgi:hypothetical protein|uniref:hypothetical protein n=1 Tax=Sphingobacterium sp. TaxID=341027 RepID=UPI002898FD93|nr:hypothetical protein [Sphingobacterium sp.]